MQLPILDPRDDHAPFPPPSEALAAPAGLLAAGGSLRTPRLLAAYRAGIFPWFGEGDPILWWSPDPRCVIFPERLHLSRRLRRTLRQGRHSVTRNRAFKAVMRACAGPRRDDIGTWISAEMIDAFTALHRLGHAESFEVWYGGELAGGIYGVHLGRVFFGESMFSQRRDGSKIALAHVAASDDVDLIDCQIGNPHLARLGAEDIARDRFLELLAELGASRA